MSTETATSKESTGPTREVSTDEYKQPQKRATSHEAENEQLQTDRDESEPAETTSFLVGVIQTVTDALDSARDENEELREENEALREDHDDLKDEFRTYRQAVRTKFERIEETQEIHDSRLVAVADGIDRVEAESSDAESGDRSEETTIQQRETPLERLLDDSSSSGIRVTASVTRALDLVSHFKQWSKSVPAGRVIRDGLKTLLSTVEGEQLAWKQVYRAAQNCTTSRTGASSSRRHRGTAGYSCSMIRTT